METIARDLPESSNAHTRHHRPAFRSPLTLRDSAGNEWPVIYEASTSNRQYHRRLSDGWAAFCRQHGVKINDTVEFRRCFKSEINGAHVLAVRVLTRRSDGGALFPSALLYGGIGAALTLAAATCQAEAEPR